MSDPIVRAGVIGAGVMGSGIAAHFANAGVRVVLLDIVPPDLSDAERRDRAARNRFAAGGLKKALDARPAAFFHRSLARLVSVGNVEDDLARLADCDLVVEAIVEQIEPKRALFERLERVVGPRCVVASNTSGLRIASMLEGRSPSFRERFVVLHFFNPVRYMKLLEIVPGPDTAPAVLDRVRRFGEDVLGKGIVIGKDTPNFVGNRVGAHAILTTMHLMLEEGLSPEDVDAITGTPMGHPKSASFRTGDMVGIDTLVHVADNCHAALPEDEEREVFRVPSWVRAMVDRKLLGDKTKGGFYRKGAGGDIETFDPTALAYRAKAGNAAVRAATKAVAGVEDPRARVRRLVADEGPAGRFAWKVLSRSLAYAARRIGEIADDLGAVDDAMRWGYAWELGPFETWDALGFAATADRMQKDGVALPAWIDRMRASGATAFRRDDGASWDPARGDYRLRPADPRTLDRRAMRRGGAPLLANDGAECWDLGDRVLGLSFKTKMNTIDPDVIAMIGQAVDLAERDFRAIVLANEGEAFCVGANLGLVVLAAGAGEFGQIRTMVEGFQKATQRIKYARVPVVAAPWGFTFGGGLELCLASASVQAAAETYAGQVEVGVGLIPGGAGNLNLLWRALEGVPEGANVSVQEIVVQVFKNIALARVATSAEEAKALGYFRRTDGVSFDRARQLVEAKARALGLAESGWHPPAPRAHVLPGESGIATLSMMVDTLVAGGYATPHDAVIARKLAVVLCGGPGGAAREVSEDEMLALERDAFVDLCREPKSQERMQYMLVNNKPLRN